MAKKDRSSFFSNFNLFKSKEELEIEGSIETIIADLKKKQTLNSEKNTLDLFEKILNPEQKTELSKKSKDTLNSVVASISSDEMINLDTKDRKDLYNVFRFIHKNIPQMSAATTILVENILSPDEMFKNVFQINQLTTFSNDKNLEQKDDIEKEKNRIKTIISNYSLEKKSFSIISNTLVCGDYFLEIYNLLEQADALLTENSNPKLIINELKSELISETTDLVSIITEEKDSKIDKEKTKDYLISLIEDEIIEFETETDSDLDSLSEALKKDKESNTKENKEDNKEALNFRQNILRYHEPENIIKVEIEGVNFGYLIIKPKTVNSSTKNNIFANYGNTIFNNGQTSSLVSKFASSMLEKIGKKINKNFLKNNEEFSKIIVSLLNEKKGAKVRFVSPDKIIHFKNESTAGANRYGESLYDQGLLIAKQYLALMISFSIFLITRAPDKRIIKVEVGADNDASAAVQNMVKALKQKEVSFSGLGTLDALPDTLTAFDDIFVPTINGEAPIQIDTVPGQQNNVDLDYLENLRKQLVAVTTVPPSLFGDSDNSYHTTLSQENQRFARSVIRFQQQFAELFQALINGFYNAIYGSNIKFHSINFQQPTFLKVEQTANIIGQAQAICDFIVDAAGTDQNTQQPLIDKIDVAKIYAPNINWEEVENLIVRKKEKLKLNSLLPSNDNNADGTGTGTTTTARMGSDSDETTGEDPYNTD